MSGTCSSVEFVSDVEKSIAKGSSIAKKSKPHFHAIRESYVKPFQLFRTIDEFSGPKMLTFHEANADRNLMQLSTLNCHNGQRKLALSVIEFLAMTTKKLDAPLVVYAGASGLATVIAATIFRRVRFVIYDKATSTVDFIPEGFEDKVIHHVKHAIPDTSKQVVVYQEWFDDAEAKKFLKFKNVLFISDIRGDDSSKLDIARELEITEDMRAQQRWAILTGSVAYMFKFRVPYLWSPEIRKAYTDTKHLSQAAAEAGVEFKPPTNTNKLLDDDIEYLDGEAHIQLYGKPNTAELRLIGFAPNKQYKTRTFSVPEIEAKMATFNVFYRSHVQFWYGRHSASFFKATFPGYDAVAEYAVASRCNSTLGRSMTSEGIKKTMQYISTAIDEFIKGKSTPEQCSIMSSEKFGQYSSQLTRTLMNKCKNKKTNI